MITVAQQTEINNAAMNACSSVGSGEMNDCLTTHNYVVIPDQQQAGTPGVDGGYIIFPFFLLIGIVGLAIRLAWQRFVNHIRYGGTEIKVRR